MSDCHDMTREERAELVDQGRALLKDARLHVGGETYFHLGTLGVDDACRLLDRALDAIEWLDRRPPRPAGQPGHRIDLDEPPTAPTMVVSLGPAGLSWKVDG